MKTIEYDKFKILKFNRDIKDSHVNKLIKSIKDNGYFNSKPISINSDFEIIDGQHRFEACKRLNIPIIYEIDNNVSSVMITMNSTSNVWRQQEFIHYYSEKGFEDYIELNNFIKSQTLSVSNCIDIFVGNLSFKAKNIRNGDRLLKYKYFNEILDLVMYFKGKLSFYNTTHFVRSLVSLFNSEKFKISHIEKLKQNAYGIQQCATITQYLTQFNKILKIK